LKIKVLFICIHNAARSQIAEALLKKFGGEKYEVASAGYLPTTINPLVVKIMQEEGVDLSEKKTQSVFSLIQAGNFYGYVITVCNRAKETECPVFPGVTKKLHWDLEDPEDYAGTEEEKLDKIRALKDRIKQLVLDFINEHDEARLNALNKSQLNCNL